MRTVKVYFSRNDRNDDRTFYVQCDVEVEGLGQVKLMDCLSTKTMESVCTEVEEAMRLKLQGGIKL